MERQANLRDKTRRSMPPNWQKLWGRRDFRERRFRATERSIRNSASTKRTISWCRSMSRLTAARSISISFSIDSGTGKAFDTEAYLRHADTCLAFVRALRFAPYTVRTQRVLRTSPSSLFSLIQPHWSVWSVKSTRLEFLYFFNCLISSFSGFPRLICESIIKQG